MAKSKSKIDILSAEKDSLSRRFRKLGSALNDELGFRDQRLRFSDTPDRSGNLYWRLVNTDLTDSELLSQQMSGLLAASVDESVRLEFGFTEQWSWHDSIYIFHSSNLRFAVVSQGAIRQPINFRLEWAERQLGAEGGFSFAGRGAAHPHWQFDSDLGPSTITPTFGQPLISSSEEPANPEMLEVSLSDEAQDLTASLASATTLSEGIRPISWFHKLHLPARAQWSDEECVMPDRASSQQHSPRSCDDLDRWLKSALRYMRHEFSIYAE